MQIRRMVGWFGKVCSCCLFNHQAGIQLWVLTGDKLETARNIGFSTKLLSDAMDGRSRERWSRHEWFWNKQLGEHLKDIYQWVSMGLTSSCFFATNPWCQVCSFVTSRCLDVGWLYLQLGAVFDRKKSVFQCESIKCSQVSYLSIYYWYISKWSMDIATHINSQFVFRTPIQHQWNVCTQNCCNHSLHQQDIGVLTGENLQQSLEDRFKFILWRVGCPLLYLQKNHNHNHNHI